MLPLDFSKLNDGRYYWKVRALDYLGNKSAWSAVRSVIVDTTQLAPLLSLPVNGGTANGTPTFSWKAAAGTKYYELVIEKKNGEIYEPFYNKPLLTVLYHRPTELINGINQTKPMEGEYQWKVIATDLAGNVSEESEVRTVTVTPLKPAAPVLVSPASGYFVNDGKTDIVLSWKPVAYAHHYEIFADTSIYFNTANKQTWSTDGSETSFRIPVDEYPLTESPLLEARYYWKVRAVNSAVPAVIGSWSAYRYFTVDRTAPATAPVLKLPANGAYTYDTTPALSVNALAQAKWYRFTVYQEGNCETNDGFVSPDVTTTSWSVPAAQVLPYDDGYHWCAKAIDAAGNESPWSETRAFTVTFQNLPKFAATTADTTPAFSWYAVSSAKGYLLEVVPVVEIGNTATHEYTVYLGVVTSHTIPNIKALDPGKYQWRLRVYSAAGSSESPWRELVILPPAPVLASPANGLVQSISLPVDLSWNAAAGAARYEVQVDNSSYFTSPEIKEKFTDGPETTMQIEVGLTIPTRYYWRIRAINYLGNPGAWSAARYFTLKAP